MDGFDPVQTTRRLGETTGEHKMDLASKSPTPKEQSRRDDAARGYTDVDIAEVSDSPEWTAEDTARSRSFVETFPDDAAALERSVKA